MELHAYYLITLIVSFILAYACVRYLKGRLSRFGLTGIDINKPEKPKISESGGMLLLPGIWVVVLALIYLKLVNPISYLFLFTITCFAAIGFFDDGFGLFKKGERWKSYVIKRGVVLLLIGVPFAYFIFGTANIIPVIIAIIGAASLANSFAGLNGWEVGSSFIVLAGLSVMVAFSPTYTSTLLYLSAAILGAMGALLVFNRYPASIFPGDSGTLLMGAFAGCLIPFIQPWYFAVLLFLPHMVDIGLKLKSNRHDMSQKSERPYVLKDGKLGIPESKSLDFAKCLISVFGPMEEKQVVRRIWIYVAANTAVWTSLFIIINSI